MKEFEDILEEISHNLEWCDDAYQSRCYRRSHDEITRLRADLAAVTEERDALLAHLAPVEAIENDKDDPTREYIPLPGGWEIQTKGKGSSYRLLDKKTGERHMILAGEAPFVQEFVTRMAKEINAAAAIRSGK